jgi:hypothetical protein
MVYTEASQPENEGVGSLSAQPISNKESKKTWFEEFLFIVSKTFFREKDTSVLQIFLLTSAE